MLIGSACVVACRYTKGYAAAAVYSMGKLPYHHLIVLAANYSVHAWPSAAQTSTAQHSFTGVHCSECASGSCHGCLNHCSRVFDCPHCLLVVYSLLVAQMHNYPVSDLCMLCRLWLGIPAGHPINPLQFRRNPGPYSCRHSVLPDYISRCSSNSNIWQPLCRQDCSDLPCSCI